jgi:methionine-rich copper-binding protein CopC
MDRRLPRHGNLSGCTTKEMRKGENSSMLHVHRALVAGALAIVLAIGPVSIAFAHAAYVSSVPAANSTVTSVPSVLVANFAEGIVPATALLTIVGPNGARADQGDGKVDLTDPNRKTMRVSLKPGLGSGKYTVNWATVSSDDGDPANGSFVFTVALPAPAAAAPAAKPAIVTPAAMPKSGGIPTAPFVAGGLALVTAGALLRRRHS